MRGPLGSASALTGDPRYIEHGRRHHERCFSGATSHGQVWLNALGPVFANS
ncbi:MAG: hypothetical protein AB1505_29065 [Candidatus Latescibacterota bacterium]